MKRYFWIAAMMLIAWSLLAYVIWSVDEAIYWVLVSVAVSLLASNLKLVEAEEQDQPAE